MPFRAISRQRLNSSRKISVRRCLPPTASSMARRMSVWDPCRFHATGGGRPQLQRRHEVRRFEDRRAVEEDVAHAERLGDLSGQHGLAAALRSIQQNVGSALDQRLHLGGQGTVEVEVLIQCEGRRAQVFHDDRAAIGRVRLAHVGDADAAGPPYLDAPVVAQNHLGRSFPIQASRTKPKSARPGRIRFEDRVKHPADTEHRSPTCVREECRFRHAAFLRAAIAPPRSKTFSAPGHRPRIPIARSPTNWRQRQSVRPGPVCMEKSTASETNWFRSERCDQQLALFPRHAMRSPSC